MSKLTVKLPASGPRFIKPTRDRSPPKSSARSAERAAYSGGEDVLTSPSAVRDTRYSEPSTRNHSPSRSSAPHPPSYERATYSSARRNEPPTTPTPASRSMAEKLHWRQEAEQLHELLQEQTARAEHFEEAHDILSTRRDGDVNPDLHKPRNVTPLFHVSHAALLDGWPLQNENFWNRKTAAQVFCGCVIVRGVNSTPAFLHP